VGGFELSPVGGPTRAPDALIFEQDSVGGGPNGYLQGGNNVEGAGAGENGGTTHIDGGDKR
jgi:hypothetical protein